jgi:hypothetical protein
MKIYLELAGPVLGAILSLNFVDKSFCSCWPLRLWRLIEKESEGEEDFMIRQMLLISKFCIRFFFDSDEMNQFVFSFLFFS